MIGVVGGGGRKAGKLQLHHLRQNVSKYRILRYRMFVLPSADVGPPAQMIVIIIIHSL